jgi:glycosyltransferase involved in cell wall biosynthesis
MLGSPGGTMIDDFVADGFEHIYLPIFPYKKRPKDAWQCVYTIRSCIKKYKVDIVHSHHRLAELYAVIATGFNKVPTVSTVHALISGKRFLSFRSDKLIAVSNAVKQMLVSDFEIQEKKISVIRNIPRSFGDPSLADVQDFKEKAGLKKGDFVVAGIGRLHPEKGFDVFLSAMTMLSSDDNIKAVLVGKGNQEDVLKQYALQNGISVFFADEMNEVELMYRSADVIVIPSRQESAGLVAIEAGFFQKPVIASSVGGLTETIKHEVTGLSVESENASTLAKAIQRLYMNRQLSQTLGEQLFRYVEEKYSINAIIEQTEGVYKALL